VEPVLAPSGPALAGSITAAAAHVNCPHYAIPGKAGGRRRQASRAAQGIASIT
jgi:hypothetical protein